MLDAPVVIERNERYVLKTPAMFARRNALGQALEKSSVPNFR